MSIMRSKDGSELIATCSCGCEESIYLKIDPNDDSFCFLAYMNGKFYSEQGGLLTSIKRKTKKIMAILFNKDYYYSDVIMTREDFSQFKEFINQF